MSLSPLPPASQMPASPSSGPLKRSIHEVDDAAVQPLGPKRPYTDFAGENQENKDPSMTRTAKSISPRPDGTPALSRLNAEVSAQQGVLNFDTETDPNDRFNSTTSRNQNPPSNPTTAPTPTSHKRKLSVGSQDIKQREKEAKERQKLEEKQKKEEEKRLKADEKKQREAKREEEKKMKEEEKKKRDIEREEKKKAKEEEKAAKEAAKEDEKRRKEEEKLKKEQAQPKLNSFFAKPQLPSASTTCPSSPSKSSHIGDLDTGKTWETQSDYAKVFPEFFLQSHTIVAPTHRFERDEESLKHVRHTLDEGMKLDSSIEPVLFRPSEIFNLIPYRRHRGSRARPVREILQKLQTAESGLMTAPNRGIKVPENPINLLRHVPMKSLKFGEDVRPPYQGTFTRAVPEATANKLARNPYYRGLPDTNYDYESEAEWEEPEEGEDLDSEEEEEEGDDGDDDMDGFLDDEDDTLVGGKRRLIVGDLEPVCSGLHWAADGVPDELKQYKMETISDAISFPIDPFSTVYWQKPRASEYGSGKTIPHRPQTLDAFRASISGDRPAVGGALPPISKGKRPFPAEQLNEFKQVVEGSDLSKIGVVEILKKRFPKVSKDTLKTTLDQVAIRVGQKEADKKWVCR